MTLRRLLILGFGGHARSVADVALDLGVAELAFVDANARQGEEFAGFPVHRAIPAPLQTGWIMLPAAGDNDRRREQIEAATLRGLGLASIISKRAYLGTKAVVMPGGFVAHHAHIGPLATIGRGAIINTAAVVDHESRVGDFTHVSVNATVAGRCRIGSFVFLGAAATVIDGINIADRVVVGAGSTVINDITEPGTYVGSPARRIHRESEVILTDDVLLQPS
jgi:UDP-N-acetylbacillosamine N-acetyltransferase